MSHAPRKIINGLDLLHKQVIHCQNLMQQITGQIKQCNQDNLYKLSRVSYTVAIWLDEMYFYYQTADYLKCNLITESTLKCRSEEIYEIFQDKLPPELIEFILYEDSINCLVEKIDLLNNLVADILDFIWENQILLPYKIVIDRKSKVTALSIYLTLLISNSLEYLQSYLTSIIKDELLFMGFLQWNEFQDNVRNEVETIRVHLQRER